MMSPQVARWLGARKAVLVAAASLGLAAGCYSTTPHRAQVATKALEGSCSDAVADVLARSGFIQLPTPVNLSMLFSARVDGPYNSFLRTGTGVGVTLHEGEYGRGSCDVTIEALSPDPSCSSTLSIDCLEQGGLINSMNPVTGAKVPGANGPPSATILPMCPLLPIACELSYAPGPENDAAVDELARRVQEALGANGRASRPHVD